LKQKSISFLLLISLTSFSLFSLVLKQDRDFASGLNKITLVREKTEYITEKLPLLSDPQLINDAMKKLASLYYLSGEPEESQKIYYSLAEIKGNSVTHWAPFFKYIHVLLDRGFPDKARNDVTSALKYRKNFDPVYIFPLLSVRVRIHLAFSEYSEALDLLEKYRNLDIHIESDELYYLYYLVCSRVDLKSTWINIKQSVADKKLLLLAEAYESGNLKPYPHAGNVIGKKRPESEKIYQAGAFASKKTAETVSNRWINEGYECWIENNNNLWKVRVRLTDKEYEEETGNGKKLFPVSK